ncbi:hypothetical protein FGE12_10615 [Aggregicoccus sp. 17bor-14]|nr:hypothetical protein [Simulacricoccus sp. 17bor-14]MRI88614.1 hypothetical protein [Aggregicoccus sp. 17bor-14]
MIRLLALLLCLLPVLGGGCSHTKPRSSGLEGLRPVVEDFHKMVRWGEYRAAARYVVPERRADFERARRELNDARDLSITDYEIDEATLAPDEQHATVVSRIQWMRLPSMSAKTSTVTSQFVYVNGAWLLERQSEGPFADALR